MVNYNNNNKKGAQGIGTLIIFIAMILVAAVAAGVLIQTASSLQSKSLDVGRQAQERLTTDIEVIQVFAEDASDGNITGSVDNITFIIRLGSGSSEIKLTDLLLKFDSPENSQALTYDGSPSSSTIYSADYQVTGNGYVSGYLSVGDLVEISFLYGGEDLPEGKTATLRLISKNGAVKPIQITTPGAMTDNVVYLYP